MRVFQFVALLAIAASTLVWSCTSDSKDIQFLYDTTWEFDVHSMRDSLDFPKLTPFEQAASISGLTRIEGMTLKFRKDSVVELRQYDGTETLGGWLLSSDRKEMTIQISKVAVAAQQVLEFTPERIVLAADRKLGFIYPKILVPAGTVKKKEPAQKPAGEQQPAIEAEQEIRK